MQIGQIMIIERNGNVFQVDPQHPTWRFFGGPSKPKTPKTSDPTPAPTPVDEEVLQKDIEKRRQRINRSGRGGTILTEQTRQGMATLLGRSTS